MDQRNRKRRARNRLDSQAMLHQADDLIDEHSSLSSGRCMEQTILGVGEHKTLLGICRGRFYRFQLLQYLTTIPVLVEHLLHASGLTFNAAQAGAQIIGNLIGLDFQGSCTSCTP